MQIVIDIAEDIYNSITNNKRPAGCIVEMIDAIKNGTPLPKGHGRIIDESTITACEWNGFLKIMTTDAPAIIEADKE